MTLTDIRITPHEDASHHLLGYVSITLDHCLVIRDIKIIQGRQGRFIAMPSRKVTEHCACCGHKNHLLAKFCNHCGVEFKLVTEEEVASRFADVVFPSNTPFREYLEQRILAEFDRVNSHNEGGGTNDT